ncbi:hypothetical protein [Streptomyces sp. NPDC047097]|uniref:hypothetical protein n=1 Tax=Streptomyces sp. NPDC047097 TaxID=3155260 RepID=UPI0033F0E8B1
MLRTRTLSLASAVVMGGLLLTACGGGDQDGPADAKGEVAAQAQGARTAPAANVIVSQDANFGDPSEGLSPRNGETCQNTRFGRLSIQTTGPVKIWQGRNCTGKVEEIKADVADVRKRGFTGIGSVRFLTGGKGGQQPTPQPTPGNGNPNAAPAKNVQVSADTNFGDPTEGLAPQGNQTCQNTRFGRLSIQTTGPVKIWEGENCTGKVQTISSNLDDVRKRGLTGIGSVRFL